MKRLLLIACSIIISVTALAQSQDKPTADTAAPKHRVVFVTESTIKPGMMAEFLVWAKNEARPLYVKAGIKEAYFFTEVFGDRDIAALAEVHDSFAALKTRNEAFAKNNSPEALAALTAGANRYFESTRTYIADTLPELSWRNPKRTAPPPYFVAVRRTIDPFRGTDYESYLKNEYLPLVKKTEASVSVSRLRFGGDSNEYRFLWALDDLADLDQGNAVVRLVGVEALRKQQQKALAGIVLHTEVKVLRLRTEISILPAPTTAAK